MRIGRRGHRLGGKGNRIGLGRMDLDEDQHHDGDNKKGREIDEGRKDRLAQRNHLPRRLFHEIENVAVRSLGQGDGTGQAAVADRPGRVTARNQPRKIDAAVPGDLPRQERAHHQTQTPIQPGGQRHNRKQHQRGAGGAVDRAGQGAQPTLDDGCIGDGESRRQDQDHLQREGQNPEGAGEPGIHNGVEVPLRRKSDSQQNGQQRQTDRQHKGLRHDVFEHEDNARDDTAPGGWGGLWLAVHLWIGPLMLPLAVPLLSPYRRAILVLRREIITRQPCACQRREGRLARLRDQI